MSTPDQNATDFTKCLQLVVERLQRNETKVATFCVRHSRGEMYIGHGCLCVCPFNLLTSRASNTGWILNTCRVVVCLYVGSVLSSSYQCLAKYEYVCE